MDRVEQLEAIEAIGMLKARYFRAIDMKDEDLLRSVFTDDAVADFIGAATDPRTGVSAVEGNTEVLQVGAAVIAAGIIAAVTPLVTVHQGFMPEIIVESETAARAVWPMADILWMPPGAAIYAMKGWGHYHEIYRREDGNWKIAHLKLTRLAIQIQMAEAA